MRRVALFAVLTALCFAPTPADATCGGGGGGGLGGISSGGAPEAEVYRVPWKVLAADGAAAPGVSGMAVLWLPESREEARGSQLLESRYLTVSVAPCVQFWLVPRDAQALRLRYSAVDGESMALLLGADGVELARVLPEKGHLRVGPLEKALRAEIDRRRDVAEARLDEAASKEKTGAVDDAVALYQEVYAQSCLFPASARKAEKSLKRLGRPVGDETSGLFGPEPDLSAEKGAELRTLLDSGIRAEFELRLDDARHAYEQAHAADPEDPVATRFLAEFHRHHSGDWQLARALFGELLARPADAISRAVALHGLGKMTIHAGEFQRGVAMFEASIAEFPLPLTYRNLAVYWNSEGRFEKAWGYVEKALELAPDETYNRIFAATYFVGRGQRDEALRVAEAHASTLEASYNLAAIWAQLGSKEKALELLARHFYQYERFDPVRTREMQEARDDIAFAAFHRDPDFIALTELATADPDSYHRVK